MRVLFSWVGFKDLNFVAAQEGTSPDFKRALTPERSKHPGASEAVNDSPIEKIVNEYRRTGKPFDKIVLFFDLKTPVLGDGIKNYLSKPCFCDGVELINIQTASAHNYSQLFEASVNEWHKISTKAGNDIEPYFNLSSGTTSMSALFIVLGQISYRDKAWFIQVEDNGKVNKFHIKFNIGGYATSEASKCVDLSEFDSITGKSAAIQKIKMLAAKAAATDFNVLIYGETGTGKELLAEAIHEASNRPNKKRFLPVNCATIPPHLAESILFGHAKGAFTGATTDRKGLFEELDGGTIFLDEVEACPPEVQAKLLRVLQPPKEKKITCREFSPLGSVEEKSPDVRIIAATNQRLENLEDTDFRKDLLTRLATLSITMPPLRERKEDIPDLAEDILNKIKKDSGGAFSAKRFDESAIKFMESCEWPGNVRQLQNALVQAVVFGEGDLITADYFDQTLLALAGSESMPGEEIATDAIDLSKPVDLKEILKVKEAEIQKRYIDAALKKTDGNKTRAAELLGITYQTMDNWQKAWKKSEAEEKP